MAIELSSISDALLDLASIDKSIYFYEEDGSTWNCDVCGGDDSTGCLMYDPTECKRWSANEEREDW